MSQPWEEFIDDLKDTAGSLAREELKGLITGAQGDPNRFIRKQGMKIARYLDQLAAGQITKEAFEGNLEDLRALAEMESLRMEVAVKGCSASTRGSRS